MKDIFNLGYVETCDRSKRANIKVDAERGTRGPLGVLLLGGLGLYCLGSSCLRTSYKQGAKDAMEAESKALTEIGVYH